MSALPRVLISVLHWNNSENTSRCLLALEQLTYPNTDVLVVDNASINNSVAELRRAFPKLDILCAESNLGYAAGNALAIPVARDQQADLLWILNPDAIPEPDTLTALVEAYSQHGDALYGSVPVYTQGNHEHVSLHSWALREDGTANLNKRIQIEGDFAACFPDRSPRRLATLHGSSLLIPLALIDKYGFMDSTFFLYSEEHDYALRLAKQGVPAFLVPASRVIHHPAGAHKHAPSLKPIILYYQARNRLTLMRRHGTTLTYAKGLLQHSFYAAAWAALSLKHGVPALQNARYTLLGILDAVRGRMGKVHAPEAFLRNQSR